MTKPNTAPKTSPKPSTKKNTSAPASPESPVEVLATEGATAPSKANAQTETGHVVVPETTPPEGDANQAPPVTHLLVVAKKEGFRRAGRAWSAIETKVSVGDFTDQQINDLAAEPMLDVVFVAE